MATIIPFPQKRAAEKAELAVTMEGTTAEIIIFPGIQFNMHGVSFAFGR